MISNYKRLFFSDIAQTSKGPLAIELSHAKGVFLYDKDGKKYLDLISGISVSNLGHSNPEIIDAVKKQAEKFMHLMVYGEYILAPQVQLASLLKSQLPETLNNVYFVNSGSEAIEGVLKLAKRHTGRTEIISFKNAYHGGTHGALSILGSEESKRAFRPLLPHIKQINYNNFGDLEEITKKTACVVVESIQAEAGVILPKKGFLKTLSQKCKEAGALLIVDEIQTGMGRTGKLFGFMHYDFTPDIITVAKAFGGGMPLGAFISSKKIMSSLSHNPALGHITTFGGHPVSCAAALKNLEILLDSNIMAKVESKAMQFVDKLSKNKNIIDIQHKGLMIAIEFDSFRSNKMVIHNCIKNGLITDWFIFADKKLRIAPPLIISDKEISLACSIINKSIDKVFNKKSKK
jgi:acetylornithine/N-succinyldiaminopimelate aminotransferase